MHTTTRTTHTHTTTRTVSYVSICRKCSDLIGQIFLAVTYRHGTITTHTTTRTIHTHTTNYAHKHLRAGSSRWVDRILDIIQMDR